jgi:hypothetical protein
MREGVGWPRWHRFKRGEPERRAATGRWRRPGTTGNIVRQPQFGQSSEGLGVARASDEEGKKMKDFHFHSPNLRRMREPFTKRRGPGLRWRAPAERPKPWLSPETRGADGGWGEKGMDGTGNARPGNVGGNLHSFRQVVESGGGFQSRW